LGSFGNYFLTSVSPQVRLVLFVVEFTAAVFLAISKCSFIDFGNFSIVYCELKENIVCFSFVVCSSVDVLVPENSDHVPFVRVVVEVEGTLLGVVGSFPFTVGIIVKPFLQASEPTHVIWELEDLWVRLDRCERICN
jgi:hypothetical protein